MYNYKKKREASASHFDAPASLLNYFMTMALFIYHTIPCAIMALATFMKPATLAPFT